MFKLLLYAYVDLDAFQMIKSRDHVQFALIIYVV